MSVYARTPLFIVQPATGTGGSRVHAKYLPVGGGDILSFSVANAASPDASTHKSISFQTSATNTMVVNSKVLNADVNGYIESIEHLLGQFSLALDADRVT